MQPHERIVCAVDFSAISDAASARATALARQIGAQLIFLHVVQYFPEDRSNDVIEPESVDPAEYQKSEARRKMAELARRLGCPEAKREVLFTAGSAWHEIVSFAEQSHADLIVLGSHGHHGIAAILGSSANGVVNRAPCDVLVVRPRP